MHFGHFGSVDRFEPTKCIFCYSPPTEQKLWTDSNRHTVGDDLLGVPNKFVQTGRRGRRPLQFKKYLQSHRCNGILDRFGLTKASLREGGRALPQSPAAPAPSRREPLRESLAKQLKCLQNCDIMMSERR